MFCWISVLRKFPFLMRQMFCNFFTVLVTFAMKLRLWIAMKSLPSFTNATEASLIMPCSRQIRLQCARIASLLFRIASWWSSMRSSFKWKTRRTPAPCARTSFWTRIVWTSSWTSSVTPRLPGTALTATSAMAELCQWLRTSPKALKTFWRLTSCWTNASRTIRRTISMTRASCARPVNLVMRHSMASSSRSRSRLATEYASIWRTRWVVLFGWTWATFTRLSIFRWTRRVVTGQEFINAARESSTHLQPSTAWRPPSSWSQSVSISPFITLEWTTRTRRWLWMSEEFLKL